MKKKLLALIIVTVMLLLSACQPTPDKEPVVGKNDPEGNISNSSGSMQNNEYPDHWTQDFQNDEGAVSIKVDALLEVPDVSEYPVVNVLPAEITKDYIKELVQYFFDGQPVYDLTSDVSKSDLNKLILQYRYDLETLQQSGQVHYTTHIFTAEEIPEEQAKIESIINDYENRLSTAEDTQRSVSSLDLSTKNDYSTCTLVDTTSGDYKSKLYISVVDGNLRTRITYSKQDYMDYDEYEDPTDDEKPKGMDMTLEEAESLAKKALADIGIEDAMRTYWSVGNYTGFSEEITGVDNSEQCFVLYFCRPVNGIPVTYFYDYEGTTTVAESYAYPWEPEVIEVDVNNHGVIKLNWENSGTTTETINQNVELLPWVDIQEKAVQQFRMKEIGQYIIGGLTDQISIEIDRITLGMMRVAKKDTSGEYMYVPVWDFFGKYVYQRESDSYSERACSMLTINAIDGSVIDRGLGY
jgi:hypothetical protein